MNKLKIYRNKIDFIDRVISAMLRKRMNISRETGREKERLGLPVYDEKRERAVLEKVCRGADGKTKEAIENIYKAIFEESKKMQK